MKKALCINLFLLFFVNQLMASECVLTLVANGDSRVGFVTDRLAAVLKEPRTQENMNDMFTVQFIQRLDHQPKVVTSVLGRVPFLTWFADFNQRRDLGQQLSIDRNSLALPRILEFTVLDTNVYHNGDEANQVAVTIVSLKRSMLGPFLQSYFDSAVTTDVGNTAFRADLYSPVP